MSLLRSRPLRQQSDKAKSRAQKLAGVKKALLKRAGFRCELCGNRDDRLDLHHVLGRSGYGRWNDALECVACLCRSCHERMTNQVSPDDHFFSTELKEAAVDRLSRRILKEGWFVPDFTGWTLAAAAQEAVARLEAAGIEP